MQQSDCFGHAKTKRPKRKMVLAAASWTYTLWVKNSPKLLSGSLGDTSNFKFFHFCQKFKMAATFGKRKFFFQNCRISCLHILWVNNFTEIAHGLGDTSNFKFYQFLSKIRKFKMAVTFGKRKIFFEKHAEYLA